MKRDQKITYRRIAVQFGVCKGTIATAVKELKLRGGI
jgi:predicted transcriptional regulator